MATIFFSQNNPFWNPATLAINNNAPDHVWVVAETLPFMTVGPRCREYEGILERNPNSTYYTIDEHFLLIAQWLRRQGVIKQLILVSCELNENGETVVNTLEVDEQGDIDGDIPGGLFAQRLKYLR